MKFVLFILLFTVQIAPGQQENTKVLTVSKSTELSNIPQQDHFQELLNADKLMYVTAGSMTGHLTAFDEFFRSHLHRNFNIGYKFFGCSLMGPELAFMNAMNRKIKNKYGEDFISKEKKLARIEFEKQS